MGRSRLRAGGGNGDMKKIYDSGLTSGNPADIDITPIGAAGYGIIVMGRVRSDDSSARDVLNVEVNGDTNVNNYSHASQVGGKTSGGAGILSIKQIGLAPADTHTANEFSDFHCRILEHSAATDRKTMSSFCGVTTGSEWGPLMTVLVWENNAAINRLRFFFTTGNFADNSRLTLWRLG